MLNDPYFSAGIVLVIGAIYTLFAVFYKEGGNEKLLNYTPNVWTALGILGTFITLFFTLKDELPMEFTTVNGIFVKSKNIDIPLLINQLTSAFSTSIVGILGAGISSIFIKLNIDKLEKENKKKYIWYKMHFEEILYNIFLENTNTNAKLDNLYKAIVDIENIGDKKTVIGLLKELNSDEHKPTLKLAESIKAISESIDLLMTDFKKELSEITTQIKNTTDIALTEINKEAITKAQKDAEDASQDFRGAIKAIIDSNKKLIENQNIVTEKTQEKILTLQTTILKEVQDKTNEVVKDFKETTKENIFESNKTLNENKNEIQKIHTSITELLTTQKNTFDTQITGVTTKVGENADEMNTKFTGVLQKMETSLNSLSEKMLTQTQTQLDAQLDLMKISIADNIKSLNDTIQLARSVQSSATITLETTTKEFAGAIEKYADAKDENKDIAEQLQNQLTELQNLLQEQTQLRKSIGSLTEKIETYDTRINDITNTINELGEIKGSLKQLTTKI